VKLSLWSDAAQQRFERSRGRLQLPVGRYAVVALELNKEDGGDLWTFDLARTDTGMLADFEIKPNAVTEFNLGPPFEIKTSMRRHAQEVQISFNLEGQAGEQYRSFVKRNGRAAPVPSLKIRDGSGRVVHAGRFEYG
jgi:hypothetical protein